ncbi:cytochrome b, partial [Paraburkholderia sp. RL17-373-BIF-A]
MSSLRRGGGDASRSTPVWDLFVRVFHWGLVGAFSGAYVLSEDGGTLHHALGYAVVGLVAARIVWGFAGTY